MKNDDKKLMNDIKNYKPVFWENEKYDTLNNFEEHGFYMEDIYDAEKRLKRFAPLIVKLFPETEDGIIESPLKEIPNMKKEIEKLYNKEINGKLFLKCDSHLKVAGSIKARGGIYEVLKHAEELALKNGRLKETDDYSIMASSEFKTFFNQYRIGVGSTGNLGLSIGIISAALGFKVDVHMSRDAKAWKKQLLRLKGANVIEYNDDYSKAVEEGRKLCEKDENAYFIDDENSRDLFLGYSVAALRLKEQLKANGVIVDAKHQLYVYLPCGVGGAPGGITFGLKSLFGNNVHCFFVEPTHSPCMLLGLLTEKFNEMHVSEYGLDNVTEADGLAVGSPSKLVCNVVGKSIEGIYTIQDDELFQLLAVLKDSENLKIEPSATASLYGPVVVSSTRTCKKAVLDVCASISSNSDDDIDLSANCEVEITHIAWATGGLFLPDELYKKMYDKGLGLLEMKGENDNA